MAIRTCPRCRIISPGDTAVCQCGYEFATGSARPVAATSPGTLGAQRPSIISWQHRYCVFMALVYVATIAIGAFMIAFRNEGADARHPAEEYLIMGVLLIAVGLVLAIAYGVAPSLAPAPWVWTYQLVLIAIGLTSPCCLPMSIPLLVGWIRTDTKAFYGRS